MESRVERISRRQFLIRLGAASATMTVVGAGVSALLNAESGSAPSVAAVPTQPVGTPEANASSARPFPNANDPVEPARGTRLEFTPAEEHYRIDIALFPPEIDGASWRLPISGLVETPLSLSLDDLRTQFTPVHQYITQQCISNPIGGDLISTQYWTGASFRDVLAKAQPKPEATHAYITGADGFYEAVALDKVNADPEIVLCYAWDGQPLPVRSGFPLRIHIPHVYGMKQPKWITGIELVSGDRDGYWVDRGWSKDAIYQATSVIDTVAMDMMVTQNGEERHIVPVGGIAFAGPRGVSKVEVRVDDGDWAEAQLRAPLNNNLERYKTWRIWRYDWPFQEGQHLFQVRMVEGDGTPQVERPAPVAPDGATGIHAVSHML